MFTVVLLGAVSCVIDCFYCPHLNRSSSSSSCVACTTGVRSAKRRHQSPEWTILRLNRSCSINRTGIKELGETVLVAQCWWHCWKTSHDAMRYILHNYCQQGVNHQ